jgi:hypothetical protein
MYIFRTLRQFCQFKKIMLPALAFLALSASAWAHQEPADPYNLVLGTQTFSPSYQFTEQPRLLETAKAIRAMGASVIKFELSRRYARRINVPSPAVEVHSLMELARDEPTFHEVLDMPFKDYILWAHCFTTHGDASWREGFSKAQQELEYRELYELVCYLLRTYSGSGKTFYLGHWEGDGWLRGSARKENDARVTRTAVRGMIDWLNTRQRAIDQAKRDTPHQNVQVWHYTEVNHVKIAMRQGRKAVVNEVLPHVPVDFVSYSSYDTAPEPQELKAALTYIESKLHRKQGMPGRRVFIGEYGFPAIRFSAREQDAMSRRVMRAGLEWGCPFILYWEMYNNEVDPNGKQRGFWLIDDRGVKQPVYYTHKTLLSAGRECVTAALKRSGGLPSYNEYRNSLLRKLDLLEQQ